MRTTLPIFFAAVLMVVSSINAAGPLSAQSLPQQGFLGPSQPSSIHPAGISTGTQESVACDDVDTCTTPALGAMTAGDTLIIGVSEYTTSVGAPTAVSATLGGTSYTAEPVLDDSDCASGTGHGFFGLYGITDLTAAQAVSGGTVKATYTDDEFYTVHATDVTGVATSPFDGYGAWQASGLADGACADTGNTTAFASDTVNDSGDIIIMGVQTRADPAVTLTADGGDTLINTETTTEATDPADGYDTGGIFEEVFSTSGAHHLLATLSASADWVAMAIALKPLNPLKAPVIATSTSEIVNGGSAVLSVTTSLSGGVSTYTCQWIEEAPGATHFSNFGASFGASGGCTTTGTPDVSTGALSTDGVYSFAMNVTDSNTPVDIVTSNVVTVTVNAPLGTATLTPANPIIDSGQSVTITATWTGGVPPITAVLYSSTTSSCSSGSTMVQTVDPATSPEAFTAVSPTSTTYYCVVLTDSEVPASSTTSSADEVTVNSALGTPTLSPAAPTIDAGQSIVLTATWSGGTSPYKAVLYSHATAACGATSTLVQTVNPATSPQAFTAVAPAATIYYCVVVTDGATTPVSTTSAADEVTVNTALSTPTITPASATIDNGQSITFSSTWTHGTAPYTAALYSSTTATCGSGSTLVQSVSGATSGLDFSAVTPSATTYYCVVVTDSAYSPASATSAASKITWNTALSVPTLSPSNPSIDTGQTVVFTASWSGGTSTYKAVLYRSATSTCSASSTLVQTVNPATSPQAFTAVTPPSSPYYYCVVVTDSATTPVVQTSAADEVITNSALGTPTIAPGSETIDDGQSVTFSATWSGGTSPYTAVLHSSTTATCNSGSTVVQSINPATSVQTFSAVSPASTTYYCVVITDSSNTPVSTTSTASKITVNTALSTPTISPGSETIDSGQHVVFSSTWSGGTSTYVAVLYSSATSSCGVGSTTVQTINPATSPATFTFVAPTSTLYYCVVVTDSSSTPVSTTSSASEITVNPTLSTPSLAPGSETIDNGQYVTFSTTWSGGTSPYTAALYSSATSACSSGSNLVQSVSGATSPESFAAVDPSSTLYYCSVVTDSSSSPVSQTSAASEITVNAALGTPTVTPSSPTIDSGQSLVLSATWSGGTGPFTAVLYSSSTSSCSSSSHEVQSINPASSPQAFAGIDPSTTTYYCVVITDSSSSPASTTSAADEIAVSNALVTPTLSPGSESIDSGQSVAFSVSWSGGTPGYTAALYSSSTSSCGSGSTPVQSVGGASSPQSFSLVTPGSTSYYCAVITDSAHSPVSTTSTASEITVDSDLGTPSLSSGSEVIDDGQSVTFTATWSGGTPSYSAALYSSPTSTCNSDSTPVQSVGDAVSPQVFSAVVPSSTTYFCAVVTDSSAVSAQTTFSPASEITVNLALGTPSISPSAVTVDNGQSVTFSATWSGGTAPYSETLYSSNSPTCSSGSSPVQTIDPATSGQDFGAVTVGSSAYFCVVLTDSASTPSSTTSSAVAVTWNAALSTPSLSPGSETIDDGQSVTFSVSWSGGSVPYAVALYSSSTSSCSSGSTPVQTIDDATSPQSLSAASPVSATYYCAVVTDGASSPTFSTSAASEVSVNSALQTPSLSPGSETIDDGQSVIFTASWSGGTASYVADLYATFGATCSSASFLLQSQSVSSGPVSFNPVTPHSTRSYCVVVTDSSSTPASATSVASEITVSPTLGTPSLAPNSPSIDSGQSLTFSATWSGGTGPFNATLYSSPTPSCSASSTQLQSIDPATSPQSFTAVAPGSTTYYCVVLWDSSSSPVSTTSSAVEVTVNSDLATPSLAPTSASLDDGQSITLTATWSGGTPDYTATLSLYAGGTCTATEVETDSDIPGTSQAFSVAPSSTTSYCVSITDSSGSDQGGMSASSGPSIITVNEALGNVEIFPSTPSIDDGQSITFIASWTGGTPDYNASLYVYSDGACTSTLVAWSAGLTGTSQSFTVSPSSTSSYCVVVNDTSGADQGDEYSTSSSLVVTVNPALSSTVDLTPASASLDDGQSITLTASWSDGTPDYTATLYLYSGGTCTATEVASVSDIAGTTQPFSVSPSSTTSYCVVVSDGSDGDQGVEMATSSSSTVTVNPALSPTVGLSPGTANIDDGQSITLTASWSGGTPDYTAALFLYIDGSCTATEISTVSDISGTSQTFSVAPSSTTAYCVVVSDSSAADAGPESATSSASTITVYSPLSGTVDLTPASASIDDGQSITLTASWSGGTPDYTATLYLYESGTCTATEVGSMSGISGTSEAFSVSPSSTTAYCVVVTDSSDADAGSESATSSPSVVTVNTALSSTVDLAPATASLDDGQSITLTAGWSGGTPDYTAILYLYVDDACSATEVAAESDIAGTSQSFSVSPSSTTSYCVVVTDSSGADAGGMSATSSPSTITVYPALSATVDLAPAAASIDNGQSVTLTASWSDGTPDYTATLYLYESGTCTATEVASDSGISGTSQTFSVSPSSTTSYCVMVTDSSGADAGPETATSSPSTISVSSDLGSASLSPASPSIDDGQSITVTASWSGGTADYVATLYLYAEGACTWTQVSSVSGISGTSQTFSVSPASTTSYCVVVNDSSGADQGSESVTSSPIVVTVNPALSSTVELTPSAASLDEGQSITLTASWSDGTPDYTAVLFLYASGACTATEVATESGISGTSQGFSVSPSSTTSYCVVVTDSSEADGGPMSATSSPSVITVNAPLSPTVELTPVSASIDDGQSITLTASWSDGTPDYTATLYLYVGGACTASQVDSVSGITGTSQTFSVSPSSSRSYCVVITDSSGADGGAESATSSASVITVNNALSATADLTPASATIDDGQSITLTASWTGGTPDYSVTLYLYVSDACTATVVASQSGITADFQAFSVSPSSTTSYCVVVTDSSGADAGSMSATSSPSVITVNSGLSATVGLTPASASIDGGQSVTLSASWSDGTPDYTATLYVYAGGTCTSTVVATVAGIADTSQTFSVSPSTTTSYCVVVSDSSEADQGAESATSSPSVITVDSVLGSVSLSPTSPSIDDGQSITVTSSWSGGTPDYTATLYLYSDGTCTSTQVASVSGISGTGQSFAVSPTSTTSYCVVVSDSSGSDEGSESVTSSPITVTVNPALSSTVDLSPATASLDDGQSITLTASWSDGTPDYTATLYLYSSGACTATEEASVSGIMGTSQTFSVSPSTTTSYCVVVTDSSVADAGPMMATSSPSVITVNIALSNTVDLTPAAASLDVGQSITLTADWSDGTPDYTATLYLYESGTCTATEVASVSDIPGTSQTFSVSPSTTTSYCVVVTDSSDADQGAESATSSASVITVNSALSPTVDLTPASASIDEGQSITLTASWSGGTPDYTAILYLYSGGECTLSEVATVVEISGTSQTFTVYPTSTTSYCVVVYDSSGADEGPESASSSASVITVNSALGPVSLSPATVSIDDGQSVTLTASWSDGTPDYTATLYLYSAGSCTLSQVATFSGISGTSQAFSVSPVSTTSYCVVVTDSSQADQGTQSVTSSPATVTLNPALSATVDLIPASASIDDGQSITLTASWSGGTPDYTATLYLYASGTCSATVVDSISGISGTSQGFSVSPTSTTSYCVVVTDSSQADAGAESATSSASVITVNLALSPTVDLTPASASIDNGQSITLTASWGGGTPDYTASLYLYESGVCTSDEVASDSGISGTSQTFSVNPSSTTSYCVVVTDSSGADQGSESSTSSASVITVNPALGTVNLLPASSSIDRGQSIVLTASWTGGTPDFTATFYIYASGACTPSEVGSVSGLSGTTQLFSVDPAVTTSYCVVVSDENEADEGAESGTSGPATVTVNPFLSATVILSPASASIDQGQSITLTADWNGGTPDYTATLYLYASGACTSTEVASVSGIAGTSQGFAVSPGSSASYCVVVTDSSDATQGAESATSNPSVITVNPALSPTVDLTPASASIDNGQSITLTASWSDGTPDYTATLYLYEDGACTADEVASMNDISGNSQTFSVSPSTTTSYCAVITDSSVADGGAESATSSASVITVNFALSPTVDLTPASASIDNGQSITLTASWSGGTPDYTATLYLYVSGACSSSEVATVSGLGGTSQTFSVDPTSSTSYCVVVTDSSVATGGPETATSSPSVITVNPALSSTVDLTPATASIDNGQSITLTAIWSGGTPDYTATLFFYASGTCTATEVASLSGISGTSQTFSVDPISTTSYCVVVSDSSGADQGSESATSTPSVITVNPALGSASLTPTSSSIDDGQSITLTASWSGGTLEYTATLYLYASGACTPTVVATVNGIAGMSQTFSVSPFSTTSYCVVVSDSSEADEGAESSTSAPAEVVVNPALSSTVDLTPASATIDDGQSITLTASWSGGTPDYTATLYLYASGVCTSTGIASVSGIAATSQGFTVSPGSSASYCVVVTDSSDANAGSMSATSSPSVITVKPALSPTVDLTPASASIDNGRSIILTASWSGGTPDYTATLYLYVSGACTSTEVASVSGIAGTSQTFSVSPSSTTAYCVVVTDSSEANAGAESATSSPSVITVNSPLSSTVDLTPASASIDNGQSITLTASWSGGTPDYTATLYLYVSGACSATEVATVGGLGGTSQTFSVDPTSTTSYCVVVTDSSVATGGPETATSSPSVITVNPALSSTVDLTPATASIDNGQSITLTASWSGGTSDYTVTLYLYASGACTDAEVATVGGISGTSQGFSVSPSSTTAYCAVVSDSSDADGGAESATSSSSVVTVSPALGTPTLSPSAATIDVGLTVTFTATWTGGTAPYNATLYSSASLTCGVDSTPVQTILPATSPQPFSPVSPSSTLNYCVVVTDGADVPVAQTSAESTVTVNPALSELSLTPTYAAIDGGESVTFTASWQGGTPGYQVTLGSSSSAACSPFILVQSLFTESSPQVFTPVSPLETTYYCFAVADAAGGGAVSATSEVAWSPALSQPDLSPSSEVLDLGQGVTFTATWTGGTAVFTSTLYASSTSSCSGEDNEIQTIPDASSPQAFASVVPTSLTYYCVEVNDSSYVPASETSAASLVVVNPALGTPTLAPTLASVDNGQSVTFTATWSGGTADYTATLYSSLSPTCSALNSMVSSVEDASSPQSFLPVTPGQTTYYCVVVQDSASTPTNATSAASEVLWSPTLGTPTLSPTSEVLDLGQSVTFTATWIGGTSAFTAELYSSGSSSCSPSHLVQSISDALSPQVFSPVAPPSTEYFCVTIVDSATVESAEISAPSEVSVNPALEQPVLSPASASIDSGDSVVFTAVWSGGSSDFTATLYSASSSSCSASTGMPVQSIPDATSPQTFTAVTPGQTTYYCVEVSDSATVSESNTSVASVVDWNEALGTPTLSPTVAVIDAGQTLTFTVTWSGGTAPYTATLFDSPSSTCTSLSNQVESIPDAVSPQSFVPVSPNEVTYFCVTISDSALVISTTLSAPSMVTPNSALSVPDLSPTLSIVDNGQSVDYVASWNGGTPGYTAKLYSTPTSACGPSGTEVLSVEDAVSPEVFATIHPSSSAYYCAVVTDSATSPNTQVSAPSQVEWSPVLSTPVLSPSVLTVDSGQTVTFTASWTGGTPQFTALLYSAPTASCNVTDLELQQISNAESPVTFAPVAPGGTQYYCAVLVDSAEVPVWANSTASEVFWSPALVTPTLTPASELIDDGQGVSFTTTWSGGTPGYVVSLYSSTTSTCDASGTLIDTVTGAASPETFPTVFPSQTLYYCAVLNDSASVPNILVSLASPIAVSPALGTPTLAPATSVIDSGQSVVFTASWTGGTASYTAALYSSATSSCGVSSALIQTVPDASSPQVFASVSPTATTYYCVVVSDSATSPETVPSVASLVTLNPTLMATLGATPATIEVGQTSLLTASATGGSSSYASYAFFQGASCTGTALQTGSSNLYTTAALSQTTTYCMEVTDTLGGTATSTVTVTVVKDLTAPTIGVTPGTGDSGQSFTLTTIVPFSGGIGPYTCQWYSKTPGAGSFSKLGSAFTCTTGSSPTTPTGPLSTIGTWSFEMSVKDSDSPVVTVTSTAISASVVAALLPAVIAASTSTLDSGQSANLSTTTSFSGGVGPLYCQWLDRVPGASGYTTLGTTFSCSRGSTPSTSTGELSTTGTWSFELQVTDSSVPAEVADSNAVNVTVGTALSAPAIMVSPNPIDTGEASMLTATSSFSGGTGPYACQWLAEIPGAHTYTPLAASFACTAGSLPTSSTGTLAQTGIWGFELQVGDSSNPVATVVSVAVTLVVNPAPVVSSLTVSPNPVDIGATIKLLTVASGGIGVLSYTYTGLPSGCKSQNASILVCTPDLQAAGTYEITVFANDSLGGSGMAHTTLTVSGNVPLITAFTATPNPVYVGGTTVLLANETGGVGTVSYAYAGLPAGCASADNDRISCTVTAIGNYTIWVWANDSAGGTARDSVTLMAIEESNGAPTIQSFVDSPSSITLGGSTTFVVTVLGGTGTLTYTYTGLPAGCASADTATLSCTPGQAGQYLVTVFVNDSVGHSANAYADLIVKAPSKSTTTGTYGGLTIQEWILVGALVAAALAGLLFFLLAGKRRKKEEEKDGESKGDDENKPEEKGEDDSPEGKDQGSD